jgi:hypothetical protein
MTRLTESQVFTATISLLALLASGTIAMEVAHGNYPIWSAGWGFGLSVIPAWGVRVLVREVRRERQEIEAPRVIHGGRP